MHPGGSHFVLESSASFKNKIKHLPHPSSAFGEV